MISTTQEIYIRYTVQNYLNQGYKYYIVHTNTRMNNQSSSDWEDLTLYFSKEPIIKTTDYSYTVSSGVRLDVITASARTDYLNERVSFSNVSNSRVSVNSYEFILTNTEGTRHMDIMALQSYQEEKDIGYNLTNHDFYIVPVILCSILLYNWLHSTFSSKLKGRVVHEV